MSSAQIGSPELFSSALKTLVDSFNDVGIFITDINQTTIIVNQYVLDIYKISGKPEDLIGKYADYIRNHAGNYFANISKEETLGYGLIIGAETDRVREVLLADGTVIELTFVPIYEGESLMGYLWKNKIISKGQREE